MQLKIPINTSGVYDYSSLFDYVRSRGWIPDPYLSSSRFSIRAGQDHPDNASEYFRLFLRDDNVGTMEIVVNSPGFSPEISDEIERVYQEVADMGWPGHRVALILNHPKYVRRQRALGRRVVVSSASLATYKRAIDVLVSRAGGDPEFEFVLPSTYQHTVDFLLPGSFTLLLNNGCQLQCLNSGCGSHADHMLECPIRNKRQYEEKAGNTDIISRHRFDDLVSRGWTSFKIAGRQARVDQIQATVEYYLGLDAGTAVPPHIDNPLSYRDGSNVNLEEHWAASLASVSHAGK